MTHSSVLLWPTDSNTHLALENSGYILGWDDNEEELNWKLSDIHSVDTSNTIRTTTCIGIIPCNVGMEEEQVHNSIQQWSQLFICVNSIQGKCENDCATCVCHKQIRIIGLWCPQNGGAKENPSSQLPRIVPTKAGPWWERDSRPMDYEQLLLYNSCESLDHYRHSFPWTQSSLDTSCILGFEKTLLRLSEANEIFTSIQRQIISDSTNSGVTDNDEHPKPQQKTEMPSHDNVNQAQDIQATTRIPESTAFVPNGSYLQKLKSFIGRHSLLLIHHKEAKRPIPLFPVACLFQLRQDPVVSRQSTPNASFIPREVSAPSCIDNFEALVSGSLDGLLGLAMGATLILRVDFALDVLATAWTVFHSRMLRDNIGWLETFPVGFKLNVALTQSMGRGISLTVNMHDFITSSLLNNTAQRWLLVTLGSIGIACGFLTMLTIAFDAIRVVTFHIYGLAMVFQKMHQGQLYLLRALWRLFRGKKKNVLRLRTDTMDYDYMQLLLGMILFTSVLFIFTTILVYYMFFTALNLVTSTLCVILWAVYISVRYFPLGKCLLRLRYPGWFTNNVYIEDLNIDDKIKLGSLVGVNAISTHSPSASDVTIDERCLSKLETVSQSLAEIISEGLSSHFSRLLSGASSFVVETISGKSSTILTVCLNSARTMPEEKWNTQAEVATVKTKIG